MSKRLDVFIRKSDGLLGYLKDGGMDYLKWHENFLYKIFGIFPKRFCSTKPQKGSYWYKMKL